MDVFSDFLAAINDQAQRKRTLEVVEWVATTFPQLVPAIKWNQPMFLDHGTFIIGFSLAKLHLAVAPEAATIQRFSEQITGSGLTHSQHLLRIRWDQAVDFALLERIIAFNIADKANCPTFWRPASK